MTFITKLDYSNNRQIKQYVLSDTQLSGTTTFGVIDALIPENFSGDTINIDALQYIKARGIILPNSLPLFTGSTSQILGRDNDTGKIVEIELSGVTITGVTSDDYVTSGSFDVSGGTLTLTRVSGATVVTNLDGRYLPITAATAAIIARDDGNGVGYLIADREPTKYSPIGLGAIDLTQTPISEPLTTYGVESLGGFSTGTSNRLPITASNFGGHQAHGYGNVVYGYYGNMAFGTQHTITNGYNFVTIGYKNSATMTATVGHGFSVGGFNDSTNYWNNLIGFRLVASSKGFTGVGIANTVYSGSATASDRPAFTVGIGDASSSAGAGYGNVISRADGFVVKYNGETTLPGLTTTLIDSEPTGRVPITREWVESKGDLRPYLTYVAKLTQTGTTAPTAVILENTLGSTPVYTYEGVGQYSIALSGSFLDVKTTVIIGSSNQGGFHYLQAYGNGDDEIWIDSIAAGGGAGIDDVMVDALIEIRVYP